jgi:hypothetical protein
MASAGDGWPKYRAAWGRVETGLANQAAQRVSPSYFRPAPAGAQRCDDVIGNSPVRPARFARAARRHVLTGTPISGRVKDRDVNLAVDVNRSAHRARSPFKAKAGSSRP